MNFEFALINAVSFVGFCERRQQKSRRVGKLVEETFEPPRFHRKRRRRARERA
jgi:hypothetical protein